MGPLDYSIQVQQPIQAALQGYQFGAAIRDDQQQQQALIAQAQEQARIRAELQAAQAAAQANPTAANYARLMTLDPKSSEGFKRAWDAQNEAQQQSTVGDLLKWGAAIKSGRPELASQLMDAQASLMESSSPDNAKALRAQAQIAKQDPQFALGLIEAMLGANPRGKDAAETLSKLGVERRAAELQPSAVKRAEADAARAESEATAAAVTAEFARPNATAELQQKAAQLGLTRAQTNQAIGLTKKYDVETQKAILEVAGLKAGTPDPSKRFEAEQKLRREYNDGTKVYNDVTEAYRRVKASKDDAVGDLSLIFGYMKMLDPGSVVREGEFATAQNAAGVPDRVWNLYNRILRGERLNPQQRTSFKDQAGKLYEAAGTREKEIRTGLERVAKEYKLNSDNIFGGRAEESVTQAPASGPTAIKTDADYAKLPSGATFIAPDGTTRRKP